ncbi:MAG: hypothetical protein ACT4N8_02905 [Sphingosinicella sp.]|uniref:hypothetical protein n=1 Tax=Sphingosinicella sp. TaxID=1917971 RepID=UPI0040377AF6
MNMRYMAGALCASALVLTACNVQTGPVGGGNTQAPANNAAPQQATGGGAPGGGAAQGSGAPNAEVQGEARQNFTVNNNTGHIVVTLNVSPSDEDSWGPDILGRDVLADGESAEVTFSRGESQCLWDIRATYDDGDTTDIRGVNLCQIAVVNLTP